MAFKGEKMTSGKLSKGKTRISFLLSALVFATSLFSISTASATADLSLPQGETLYAIQYSGSNVGSLFSIDPKTGTYTLIGTEDRLGSIVALGATYNSNTKIAYWTSYNYYSSNLYSVNLVTGKSTDLGPLLDNEAPILVLGIGTNSDGQMYVLYSDGAKDLVGKLNESNGSITDSHPLDTPEFDADYVSGSFAFNSATSTFYSTTYLERYPRLWSINISGQVSLVATSLVSDFPYSPCGLSIDSNGNFWTVFGDYFSTGKLTEWDSQASSQRFTVDGMATYALFIAPSPNDGVAQRAAEEARRAEAAAAAAAAKKQQELTEILSVVPAIAGLALNLGTLTNSVLAPKKSTAGKQKCVKGSSSKNVKKGAKCPKGYKKK